MLGSGEQVQEPWLVEGHQGSIHHQGIIQKNLSIIPVEVVDA